jgi:hypothetical protein
MVANKYKKAKRKVAPGKGRNALLGFYFELHDNDDDDDDE